MSSLEEWQGKNLNKYLENEQASNEGILDQACFTQKSFCILD